MRSKGGLILIWFINGLFGLINNIIVILDRFLNYFLLLIILFLMLHLFYM